MSTKVAIITGASSGIGLACARQFASKGYAVVLAARSLDKLTQIESELQGMGCKVLIIKADVCIEDDCKRIIDQTIRQFQRIDILINNAGISMRATFLELDLKVIHSLMDTNFWGTVYCTKYALPYILQQKGSVVGVSSIAGFMGLPGRTGYSASKFAMQGLLETIRVEHLYDGLHVMIVAPGFTASNVRNAALNAKGNMQGESPRDENKMMTSEKVAGYIYKGIIKRKRLVILTLEGKLGVFLRRLIPGFVDKIEYAMMKKEPNSPLK
jgi:short-subunit dehydrogenase